MDETNQLYVRRNGRVEGPWSIDKLQSEVRLKKLGRFHEVSKDGNSWTRADKIDGLFPKAAARARGRVMSSEQSSDGGEDELELEPGTTEAVWYCVINDQQEGPMPLNELAARMGRSQLLNHDLVWREGFSDWLPVENVPELGRFLHPTSVPGPQQTDAKATRLSATPQSDPGSKLPLASALTAAFLLFGSWFPGVGLLGVIPIILAIVATYLKRIQTTRHKWYAGLGIAIGALEIVLGIIVIVVVVVLARDPEILNRP